MLSSMRPFEPLVVTSVPHGFLTSVMPGTGSLIVYNVALLLLQLLDCASDPYTFVVAVL